MANLTNLYDPNAEGNKEFGKLPTGQYLVQITDSDMKATAGNAGSYLQVTYEVLDGEHKGRKHWDNFNFEHENPIAVEIANRKFASLREAVGVANPRDSQELHYKPLVIGVKFSPAGSVIESGRKKGQTRDRDDAETTSWKKAEGGSTQSAPAAASAGPAPWQRNAA